MPYSFLTNTSGYSPQTQISTHQPINMSKILVAFDLYGTLLSTESIAKELAQHFGEQQAKSIAAVWRKYQLEYTWRLNSMSMLHTQTQLNVGRPLTKFLQNNINRFQKSPETLYNTLYWNTPSVSINQALRA
jgi:FMN phosphatase YigB (HAD superfamily)